MGEIHAPNSDCGVAAHSPPLTQGPIVVGEDGGGEEVQY